MYLDDLDEKLARALERRFGKSVMPFRFSRTPLTRRATDIETGAYVAGRLSKKGRLIVTEEQGGAF